MITPLDWYTVAVLIGSALPTLAACIVAYTAAREARKAAESARIAVLQARFAQRRQTPAQPWGTPPPADAWNPPPTREWTAPVPPVLHTFYTAQNFTGLVWSGQQAHPRYPYRLRGVNRTTGRPHQAYGWVQDGTVFELSAGLRALAHADTPAWGMEVTEPLPIHRQNGTRVPVWPSTADRKDTP